MDVIKNKIDFQSLKVILFVALIIRLIASIFAQGYGMHDDHFLVIEASKSWVDHFDYNSWLPWSDGFRGKPEGHSFTYVGLNYIYFYILDSIGIANPKILMFFNRLIHALFSLLIVYFGYKITEKLSNKSNAATVGWILALQFTLPFISVRNLVEIVSVPFLMWGCWLIIQNRGNKYFLFAGLLAGMAISFRYQIAIFSIGIAVYFMISKKWKEFFFYSLGNIITFCITQGIVDFFIWGYPFAEFLGYTLYNMNQGTQYLPNQNYAMYFLVLMGSLLVPFGILMMIGFLNSWKKYAFLFIPTMFFLVFHTLYPNRQERFILSILPFFIILGVLGFEKFRSKEIWNKWWRGSMLVFWILNIPLLFFMTTFYSKKSRVEAMYSLYHNKISKEQVLLECSAETKPSLMPCFYSNSWEMYFSERNDSIQPLLPNDAVKYDYIFFFGEEKLKKRIKDYKKIYPNLTLAKKCDPSMIDVILRKMNHHNANQYIEVWKTGLRKGQ